jgi:transposase
LSREEILTIYAQGPEAVVDLVEKLLTSQAELVQQIQTLTARVQELETRLNKDSHNSHKPPSSDGLAKLPRRRSRRVRSGKASGGQPGHPGTTLVQVEHPDEVVAHRVAECQQCGASLESAAVVKRERRQVFELPPIQPVVIEHQVLHQCCPKCQQVSTGQFPTEVTQLTQYGPALKALAVYLHEYQHLPLERTQEFFQDVIHVPLSEGTLANARATCAERLEPVETAIKEAVTGAAVVNYDETGTRIEGKTRWLHVAATPDWTYYAVHAKRGPAAMNAIGILPAFRGTAVHDAWGGYFTYTCAHGLCNVHLLRDLTAAADATGQRPASASAGGWPQRMSDLLLEIKAAVERARQAGQAQLSTQCRAEFIRQYQLLITQGLRANPPPKPTGKRGRPANGPIRSLLLRLQDRQSAVLAFMHDFRVPFSNNLAERDVRMAKVRQKIGGGFRSWRGAEIFCRIRGYLSTMRKQGQNPLAALNSVFVGHPLMPRLTAE